MGYYINPGNSAEAGLKEKWLKDNGIPCLVAPKREETPKDHCIVCLVDNGWMTAAAILYNEREFKDFSDPSDCRSKKWYFVKKELLTTVSTIRMDSFK